MGRPGRTVKRGAIALSAGKRSTRIARAKGRKRATNAARAQHLHQHIVVHRHSPEVAARLMKKDCIEHAVCFKTIYNHIDKGLVPGVANKSLWGKRKRRKGRKTLHRKRKHAVEPGRGIEDRPAEVEDRQEAGHWEIDLVVGGKGKGTAVLLTLTERKTRKQLIRKLKDRTQRAVARSVHGGSRTRIYYAHPYSSWERGSNENANRMIRRFIPKGCDISGFTHRQIQQVEDWINNYPRKILDVETAEERFITELAA